MRSAEREAAAREAIAIAVERGNENHELNATLALCRVLLALDPADATVAPLLEHCRDIAITNHLHQYGADVESLAQLSRSTQ